MEVVWGATVAGATISVIVSARAYTAVRKATIRASVAKNAQEYAMLEKMSERPGRIPKKKRTKTPAPQIYGL